MQQTCLSVDTYVWRRRWWQWDLRDHPHGCKMSDDHICRWTTQSAHCLHRPMTAVQRPHALGSAEHHLCWLHPQPAQYNNHRLTDVFEEMGFWVSLKSCERSAQSASAGSEFEMVGITELVSGSVVVTTSMLGLSVGGVPRLLSTYLSVCLMYMLHLIAWICQANDEWLNAVVTPLDAVAHCDLSSFAY